MQLRLTSCSQQYFGQFLEFTQVSFQNTFLLLKIKHYINVSLKHNLMWNVSLKNGLSFFKVNTTGFDISYQMQWHSYILKCVLSFQRFEDAVYFALRTPSRHAQTQVDYPAHLTTRPFAWLDPCGILLHTKQETNDITISCLFGTQPCDIIFLALHCWKTFNLIELKMGYIIQIDAKSPSALV